MTGFNEVEDSGRRQEFPTGSVRDTREGKGRYDLISMIALERLAKHYENGAKKYGDHNWEKGQPLSRYLDSTIRHVVKYMLGSRVEDHMAAVAWNAFAFIHTEQLIKDGKLPKELDDCHFIKESEMPPLTKRVVVLIQEGTHTWDEITQILEKEGLVKKEP